MIKAVMDRIVTRILRKIAQVPLADHAGVITSDFKGFGNRDFMAGKSGGPAFGRQIQQSQMTGKITEFYFEIFADR